jgi:hypothetical protein
VNKTDDHRFFSHLGAVTLKVRKDTFSAPKELTASSFYHSALNYEATGSFKMLVITMTLHSIIPQHTTIQMKLL